MFHSLPIQNCRPENTIQCNGNKERMFFSNQIDCRRKERLGPFFFDRPGFSKMNFLLDIFFCHRKHTKQAKKYFCKEKMTAEYLSQYFIHLMFQLSDSLKAEYALQ